MTGKDKSRLSRIELLKLSSINKQIDSLYQKYDEIYSSLLGTGIDYSKDRVMTTPVNAMETIICDRLSEIEGHIDKLLDQRKKYLSRIYNIQNDNQCNILIERYNNCKSLRRIAKERNQSKTNINRLEQLALISYYDTNYCINT